MAAVIWMVAAAPALAQFGGRPGQGGMGGPPGGPPGGRDRPGGERGDGATHPGNGGTWAARHEERLHEAWVALQLRPEQEALWVTYEARVRSLVADLTRPVGDAATGSALRQIGGRIDLVRNRLTALEDVAEAASRLYAALDEPQRRTADRLLSATVPPLYSSSPVEPVMPERGGRLGGRESPR